MNGITLHDIAKSEFHVVAVSEGTSKTLVASNFIEADFAIMYLRIKVKDVYTMYKGEDVLFMAQYSGFYTRPILSISDKKGMRSLTRDESLIVADAYVNIENAYGKLLPHIFYDALAGIENGYTTSNYTVTI